MSTGARRLAVIGGTVLAALVLCAVFADWISPYDPSERVGRPFGRPSGQHWLGTDDVGHDLLSVLIHGARISLLVGVVAAFAATVIGAAVGVVAGYSRGWVDTMLMRIVDVVLSMPVLPLTIVIGVFAGPGLRTQMVVITGVLWAGLARELRSQVLSLRERDYLQAIRAMGGGPLYALRHHVLPAVFPLVIPQFVLATKTAIMLEASLSFLGLGDITAPSWGAMLSLAHARSAFLTDAWIWWVLPPGLAIAATILGFALLGNALEERSRPILQRRKPSRSSRKATAAVAADRPSDECSAEPLIIEGLTVSYGESTPAVSGVDLTVSAGELVGLVGESGSGKSTVAAAAMGLLPGAAEITAGTVRVCGRDLSALNAEEKRALCGSDIALIPQEAMSALNPVYTIGFQLVEMIRQHSDTGRAEARIRAAELLETVGIDPARIARIRMSCPVA